MRTSLICLTTALFLIAGVTARAENEVALKEVWQNIEFHVPVCIVIPPDGSDRLFLVDLNGKLYVLPEDREASEAALFLDFSDRKMTDRTKRFTEEGLLGLAFHPGFRENRKFYVYYTLQEPRRSVLSEFTVSETDPGKADMESERVLLEFRQPFWNHNSGNLLFGQDGFLYIGVGDGGLRNDARLLAQNLFAFSGKILRIDVDSRSGSRGYGIPEDNPFVGAEGALDEIWAYGLRNPWGMWEDPQTGIFWCADVGQDLWEEIDHIEKGGNYGWSFREGLQPFVLRTDAPPEDAEFIDPVIAYGRPEGFSVTGGFVYRGDQVPALKDHYIYGDYKLGRIWAAKYDAAKGEVVENREIYVKPNPEVKGGYQPNAFCADENGEIITLSWDGKLYQLVKSR